MSIETKINPQDCTVGSGCGAIALVIQPREKDLGGTGGRFPKVVGDEDEFIPYPTN